MKLDLTALIQSSGADGALIINKGGELIESLGISHEANIAAMMSATLEMINGMSEDLFHGGVLQLTCKSEKGVFLIQKFDENNIVCLTTNDLSKLGFIMMSLKAVKI